ncbi:hypothetical protein TB2_017072 [Malus domestica]
MKDFRPKNGVPFLWKFASLSQTKTHSVERARLSGLRTSAEKPCPSFPPPPSFAEIEAQRSAGDVKNKYEGIWRLSKLGVSVDKDPGKDFLGVSDGLLEQIARVLEFPGFFDAADGGLHASNVLKEPKFVYIVEMDVDKLLSLDPRTWGLHSELEPKVGLVEHMPEARKSGDSISIIYMTYKKYIKVQFLVVVDITRKMDPEGHTRTHPTATEPKIAVVGSGSSGLFAALVLAEFGAKGEISIQHFYFPTNPNV